MNYKKLLSLIAFVLFFSIISHAQNENESPVFIPEQGIEGKDVIWWPTPFTLVEAMLEKAQVGPNDKVVDLGSGDGRIVIEAAKLGATAIGIEYNPDLVKLSEFRAKSEGVADKATFLNMDLFEFDLADATVITMYLLSDLNMKLRPTLLKLKPGTRIVSNTFDLDDWEADEEIKITTKYNYPDGTFRHNVTNRGYFWIVPADVSGQWSFMDGTLSIVQNFQFFEGSYTFGNESNRVVEGRITGDKISFLINGIEYSGIVDMGSMKGIFQDKNKVENKWEAIRINK